MCTPCEGAVTDDEGRVVSWGWHQPATGQSECLPCPDNAIAEAAEASHVCISAPGFYGLHVEEGLNGSAAGDLRYLRCSPTEICLGNNTCEGGYQGSLCAQCEERFYRDGGSRCQPCPEDSGMRLLVMGLIAVAVVLLVMRIGIGALIYIKKDVKGLMPAVMFVQASHCLASTRLRGSPAATTR